jgi:hypothetical protein
MRDYRLGAVGPIPSADGRQRALLLSRYRLLAVAVIGTSMMPSMAIDCVVSDAELGHRVAVGAERQDRHFEDAVNGFHGVCYRARESEVAKASGRCARRDIICRIPAASAQRAFEDADLWRRRRHDGGAPYRQWQDATPVGRSRGRAAAIWH